MDVSGMIEAGQFDPRAVSSAAYSRAIMAPQYITSMPYSSATSGTMGTQLPQPQQQNPFSSTTFGHGSNVPSFGINYIQQRPQIQMLPHRSQSRPAGQNGYSTEQHSPLIKTEIQPTSSLNINMSMNSNTTASDHSISSTPTSGSGEINFGTHVDTLMKAIQTKAQPSTGHQSPIEQIKSVVGYPSSTSYQNAPHYKDAVDRKQRLTSADFQDDKSTSKRYRCNVSGCDKAFHQKTHLEIHIRAHTGQKPYSCKAAGCNQRFSQLGNLKTHERRHTGERPYSCEVCGKTFAQRGNVRAHKIVHAQLKPYECKLEQCGKMFTQLGNLKSHMNKFHAIALRNLTNRFASIQNGDTVSAADKDLFEYFAKLYRNSNKGIKGRGKDRKVGSHSSHNSGNGMSGFVSRGMTSQYRTMPDMHGMAHGLPLSHGIVREGSQNSHSSSAPTHYAMSLAYEDDGSGSGSQGSGSSAGSMYGVEAGVGAPVDAYETEGRDLAFGDRIY